MTARRARTRCLGAACAAAWVLAAVPPAAAASVTVVAERSGAAIELHASAVLHADPATAWRVLTDYERYPAFIPDLRRSRVVSRRGSSVVVEQTGVAALWLFRLPVDIRYEIDELPPGRLRSRAVAGSVRALASCYTLTPSASGLRLEYAGRLEPRSTLFEGLQHAAIEHSVGRQFQALADEIERRSALPHPPADTGAP